MSSAHLYSQWASATRLYQGGVRAAVAGESFLSDPHQLGSYATRAWRDGWTDGDHTRRIRELNDQLRTSLFGGRVMASEMVQDLHRLKLGALVDAVRGFMAWDAGNDPYGEHDFGAVLLDGENYFFKIDYLNKSADGGSENPADPAVTLRVLTIMHSSEY